MVQTKQVSSDWRSTPTISVGDAASLLGINRGGAYEAARRGELPVIRLGRRLLVPTSRLAAMLDAPDTGAAA